MIVRTPEQLRAQSFFLLYIWSYLRIWLFLLGRRELVAGIRHLTGIIYPPTYQLRFSSRKRSCSISDIRVFAGAVAVLSSYSKLIS